MDREAIKKKSIINNEAKNRFELELPEGMGVVEYDRRGNKFFLMHTEIPESAKGLGIASILVTKVMEYLKSRDYKMNAFCPYVKTFLKRHPEWETLK